MQNWLIQAFFPYLLIVFPLVILPGPDSLVIMRNSLTYGTKFGISSVAGVQAGLIVHLTLALIGISFVIYTLPNLYSILVVLGAGYLAWLGWRCIRSRVFINTPTFATNSTKKTFYNTKKLLQTSFTTAMLTNLLNPKVLILFFTLLPGFLVLDIPLSSTHQLVILVCTLIIVNTIWQLSLAFFCGKLNTWLLSPSVSSYIGKCCGVVLLIMAGVMLYDHIW